jgi:hypothetical protein
LAQRIIGGVDHFEVGANNPGSGRSDHQPVAAVESSFALPLTPAGVGVRGKRSPPAPPYIKRSFVDQLQVGAFTLSRFIFEI